MVQVGLTLDRGNKNIAIEAKNRIFNNAKEIQLEEECRDQRSFAFVCTYAMIFNPLLLTALIVFFIICEDSIRNTGRKIRRRRMPCFV